MEVLVTLPKPKPKPKPEPKPKPKPNPKPKPKPNPDPKQVGPASTLLVLAGLRSGGRAQAATASLMRLLRVTAGPAGALAGQMALAVTLSSALFPLVVLGAAALGPRLARRQS